MSRFTGTATLLGLMLRRDRVRLPAWTLGVAAFWFYCTRAVPAAYPEAELSATSESLLGGPMGRLLVGPAHGLAGATYDQFLVGGYGLYVILLVSVMSVLVMVRHTRAEEQSGRSELLRSSVVGGQAMLAAASVTLVITNVAVAAGVWVVSVSSPHLGAGGSTLFAVGVGLAGLSFAAVAALTAQLSESSRAASGLAGAVVGVAFALRAVGDMADVGGSALSWLSPLAWPQQTAPFVLDRWWPLWLSAAFTVALAAAAFALSARRDLGASLLRARPGPARASRWLRSPFTLWWRLQRSSIIGWAIALVVSGFIFGAWSDAMAESAQDLPATIVDVLGTPGDVVAGYLEVIALSMALLTATFAVISVQTMRNEELSGRADPLLAAPVSRAHWSGAGFAVTVIAATVMLAVTGIATGTGALFATGDAADLTNSFVAHLGYIPAVVLVAAVAVALFGATPHAMAAAWVVVGYGLFIGVFGPLLDVPRWMFDISPFEHAARAPGESLDAVALVLTAALAALIAATGIAALRRRDID